MNESDNQSLQPPPYDDNIQVQESIQMQAPIQAQSLQPPSYDNNVQEPIQVQAPIQAQSHANHVIKPQNFLDEIDKQIFDELLEKYRGENGLRHKIIERFKQSNIKNDVMEVTVFNSDDVTCLSIKLSPRWMKQLKSIIKQDDMFKKFKIEINRGGNIVIKRPKIRL